MRQEVFTFPSDLQVEMKQRPISAMKRSIESLRAGLVEAQTAALVDSSIRVVDPGNYDPQKIVGADGNVMWKEALTEDRIYGLLAMRMVSYDNGFNYGMELDCPSCRERIPWSFNLKNAPDGDLIVYPFPEESKIRFRGGEPFEFEFMGKKILWRMLNGHDELLIEKLGRQDPDIDTDDHSLALRLVEVEGVDASDKVKWISSMGEERLDLQEKMEDQACGLDTMMDVYCKACQTRFENPLPFGADFWVPLQKIRKKRRMRAARAHGVISDQRR